MALISYELKDSTVSAPSGLSVLHFEQHRVFDV